MKIKLFTNSGVFDRSVTLDGFTMTDHLTLSRAPLTALEAATKRYVDNFPYNLDVENIVGGPVAIERIASGITGDVTMYNGTQTVLKSVTAAGSYSRVTVSAKGQVITGVAPSADNAPPTLMFGEITGRPTQVSGYAADPTGYIHNTAGVDNTAFTGALTLYRPPTTGSELASYGYLTGRVSNAVVNYKLGEVVLKPNTVTQTGFLKANGGVLDKTTYAALYAIIGDTYSAIGGGAGGYMGQPWRQQYAFNPTDNGVSQVWTTATALPGTVTYSQAIVTNSRVYLLGGQINGAPSATVYTAPINADGTLGTWTTATALPGTVYYSQAIVTKNRVYLLGGVINGAFSSTVYTAPINTDGTLDTWTTATALPGTVADSQAIVTNSRVYLLGGQINGTASATVYTAPINTDGTLGTWTTATALPGTVTGSQAIVTKSRVYLLSGFINGAHSSTVYTAPINADGTLGTWTTATALPTTVTDSQAIVTNSRVYLLGGAINAAYSSTVYTAPINADGTLGTWTTATALPGTVAYSQAIVTKNRVYLLGGYNGVTSATVYTAPFAGGTNDYLTLIANNTIDTTTQFKLPDLSASSLGIYEYYIRAV